MLSVSQIARQFGLSRTAILYYESVGLLKPAHRSAAGYRLYGEKEIEILGQIRLYRSVGLRFATSDSCCQDRKVRRPPCSIGG